MAEIPILFEDGEALVIDKPAGLPIDAPRRGGPSLADHLTALRFGFQRLPVPVHRLDTDTSGCLLLARNPKALKRFGRAFEERLVTKTYIGVVAGAVADEEGIIDLPLAKTSSVERGWRMLVDESGKQSVTHWRKRPSDVAGLTPIEFQPETGRTHQIRVHAAETFGRALLGDPVYGHKDARVTRTMLHAAALTVPREGKPAIAASSPLPEDFRTLGFA